MADDDVIVGAGELLPGLTFPQIEEGHRPVAAFVMIKCETPDGVQWWTRRSLEDGYDEPAFSWQLSTWVASEFADEVKGWNGGDGT